MNIPLLPPDDYRFPDPAYALAECDGLVGVSTDMDIGRLLSAYRNGIFPWHSERGYIYWFATAPRTVLLPHKLHIGKSLAKTLRNKPYRVSVNLAFSEVIAACAATERPNQQGSWIAPEFQAAYTALHRAGHAHSFECWYPDADGILQLAGGLYGVQIGRVFYGESMFARHADASKTAFSLAVPHLAQCGIELIDCQQDTDHLRRFGSENMAFDDFQTALHRLNRLPLIQNIRPAVLADTCMPSAKFPEQSC
ncbi:leucyl/phenylalanyl-tRNA--protein transferase [Neisseria animalis]|uniref:Leucyl/phenylalanyl-tRNA--protein transferase n=1 Tax=Neisseria animalis TaxID=492 RepID=A0A5P3MU33_NEIAN|nr:leucyl/phenylalanyl-tRNA--protein transferase [Neisseria animalis]QEY25010.1 leucyl/phenylalanyl-tRNA--protein transferase [Neisseria animalis]ROW32204.1 leucyl/phenylalanyl-tRNA--protein transferase [Neisseria animalis]VEE06471.1 leucyl/phenylalanyl-tRNA--protein transferase [Neisseria animalis]